MTRHDPSKPHATQKFLLVLWSAVVGLTLLILGAAALVGWADWYRVTIMLVVVFAGLISVSLMAPIIRSVQLTGNGLYATPEEHERAAADRSGTEAVEFLLRESQAGETQPGWWPDEPPTEGHWAASAPDPRFKPTSRHSHR